MIALDGESFLCNQRTAYQQAAVFDVIVRIDDAVLDVEEVAYDTVASPCEPGERRLARYRGRLSSAGITLAWDGGEQVLRPLPAREVPRAALELPRPPGIAGAWRWVMRGHDGKGQVRDEVESWELAVNERGDLGGTYVREVVTWALDGSTISCAGAASWRFTDRYTVRGTVDGDAFTITEITVDAGDHPCLAPTPTRHLDAGRGVRVGDHLVLTWQGDRRQVLHRAE